MEASQAGDAAEVTTDGPVPATMIMTAVAQIVAQVDADYLAELISEYHAADRQDMLEIDVHTYINPRHIITFGAAQMEEQPKVQVATSLPGMRA